MLLAIFAVLLFFLALRILAGVAYVLRPQLAATVPAVVHGPAAALSLGALAAFDRFYAGVERLLVLLAGSRSRARFAAFGASLVLAPALLLLIT